MTQEQMTVLDRGWRYDPSRLAPQWDSFNQRFGYLHPVKPSVCLLGYTTGTFMGWTYAEAVQACDEANAVLAHDEC